ncbi:dephospho-CoA kinase [Chloroflexi bacterium TSY]|nr:dephospho-CoA kinase [Chloroflexi bacterium TSY]
MTKNSDSQPYIIGLTGNIATGKSTILAYLAAKGAHVIDADKLAHVAMYPDGPAYHSIVDAFGRDILDQNGQIVRAKLGAIVFQDPAALKRLENISHPAVYQLAQQEIEQTEANIVILEAIKLLDGGQTISLCDAIWVVTASEDTQLRRLREHRGMDEETARSRMSAQSSQEEKVKQADQVINNDGNEAELFSQLDNLWAELQRNCDERTH